MDRIRFFSIVRAIEREAARWGYHGDLFAESEDVPLIGTYRQQMQLATIGADISRGPTSTADRQLTNRLIRAAVLLDATSNTNIGNTCTRPDARRKPARRRAW